MKTIVNDTVLLKIKTIVAGSYNDILLEFALVDYWSRNLKNVPKMSSRSESDRKAIKLAGS